MPRAKSLVTLLVVVLASVWLAYSGPRGNDAPGLWSYLALMAALAPLFLAVMESSPAALYAAIFGVALFGLYPAHVEAVADPDQLPLLWSAAGIAAGLALYWWKPSWRRWGIFALPVAATAFRNPQSLAFAPLLCAFILLFAAKPVNLAAPVAWALLASLPALFAHPAPQAPGILSAIVLGLALLTTLRPATRPISFGLWWFLFLSVAAPNSAVTADAGLALAASWLLALGALQLRPAALPAVAAVLIVGGFVVVQKNIFLVALPPANTATADDWLLRSLDYGQRGKYLESIAASRAARQLKPGDAQAYLYLGAAFEGLSLWDDAIQAERDALKLQPGSAIAQQNLDRLLNRKYLGIEPPQ